MAEGAQGVNQDDAPRRHPAHGDDTTGAITTSGQWHDAELAMKVARHSFDSWLVAGHEDTPSLALRHACHTHAALHEAARGIAALIETFRVRSASTPMACSMMIRLSSAVCSCSARISLRRSARSCRIPTRGSGPG